MLGEFELIARCFAPLAGKTPGALGLTDDAALLEAPPGHSLVLAADAAVAGLHFLEDDPPETVGRKVLRVNLSDLAAMGARPIGYLMTLCRPGTLDEAWFEAFCAGLAEDQKLYGVSLLGGDTTGTTGPLTLSITAIGVVPGPADRRACLTRAGARKGDLLFVSGSIGDAGLGLKLLQGEIKTRSRKERDFLTGRYRLPQPRVELGQRLLEQALATAALDVSDGLLADAGHICEASGLALDIELEKVPLSPAARRLVGADPSLLPGLLAAGDDYELLFTAPASKAPALAGLAAELGLPLTEIGRARRGKGVRLLDATGKRVKITARGWTHF